MDDNFIGGNGASFWAMLVGIDRYKTQKDLCGCVDDVEAMRILLVSRYNVPEEHIRVLTDEEARRANHPEYATSLDNLAAMYQGVGNFTAAEHLHRQALEIREKVLGEVSFSLCYQPDQPGGLLSTYEWVERVSSKGVTQ